MSSTLRALRPSGANAFVSNPDQFTPVRRTSRPPASTSLAPSARSGPDPIGSGVGVGAGAGVEVDGVVGGGVGVGRTAQPPANSIAAAAAIRRGSRRQPLLGSRVT